MQKYLCVKGSGGGGLGDAVRSVLTGIVYAKLTGRTLYVDWRHGVFDIPGVNAFDKLLRLHGIDSVEFLPKPDSIAPLAWRGRLQHTMHDVYVADGNSAWSRKHALEHYSIDISKLDHPEEVLVLWDFDQLPKLIPLYNEKFNFDYDLFGLMSHVLREHLSLNVVIQNNIDLFFQNCLPRPCAGVHVRSTLEASRVKALVDLPAYYEVLDRVMEQHDDITLFLATDNLTVENEIKRRYVNVVVREKWFAAKGDSLHLNKSCPNLLESTMDAVVEMFLLAYCDYLTVSSNSSFSIISRIASVAQPDRIMVLSPKTSIAGKIKQLTHRLAS